MFGGEMSIDNFYHVSQSPGVAAKLTCLVLGTTLATGTGGGYFPENVKDWISHPYIEHRLPDFEVLSEESSLVSVSVDVRTILEHIENIKNVFNVPISNIADMLNVSRQAVYKWLSNISAPEQNKKELIIKFSQVADEFKEAGIIRSGILLKMKAFGGRSLGDILLTSEAPNVYVAKLINEARIMESSYKKSGLSESKTKPTNEWQSYISIPGFPEKK